MNRNWSSQSINSSTCQKKKLTLSKSTHLNRSQSKKISLDFWLLVKTSHSCNEVGTFRNACHFLNWENSINEVILKNMWTSTASLKQDLHKTIREKQRVRRSSGWDEGTRETGDGGERNCLAFVKVNTWPFCASGCDRVDCVPQAGVLLRVYDGPYVRVTEHQSSVCLFLCVRVFITSGFVRA